MDFQSLAAHYRKEHLSKKSSGPYYERLWKQFFAGWTEHKTRLEIRAWHLSKEETPTHANKGLGFLKAMYAWGINQGLYHENPALGIKRFKTFARERVFTNQELARMLTFLDFASPKVRAFLTLVILSGCRMSEARQMKWAYLDLNNGCWYKPTTKNGMSQRLPIPSQAMRAIFELKQEGEYVFMGHYGRCWSRCGAEKAWSLFRRDIGLQSITLHDFRRTVATKVYEHEKDEFLVKAILNHYDGRPIAVYIRQMYDRIATALQANADRFWSLKQEVHHDATHPKSQPGPVVNWDRTDPDAKPVLL